jgi:predicted nucleic acid-binding protein
MTVIDRSTTCLLDTNILLRVTDYGDPEYKLVSDFVEQAIRDGFTMVHFPQNVVELWSVCTRPKTANGKGRTIGQTALQLAEVNITSQLLEDIPEIHQEWQTLGLSHRVSGRAVYDARLVAAMVVHGVPRIITRNAADFYRFSFINTYDPADGHRIRHTR